MRTSLAALAALAFALLLAVADGSSLAESSQEDAVTVHAASRRQLLNVDESGSLLHRSLLSHSEMTEGYKTFKPKKPKKEKKEKKEKETKPKPKPKEKKEPKYKAEKKYASKHLPSDLKKKAYGSGKHYFHSRKIKGKKIHRQPKAYGSPPPVYKSAPSSPPPAYKPKPKPKTPLSPPPVYKPKPKPKTPSPPLAKKLPGGKPKSPGYKLPSPPPPRAYRTNAPSGNAYQHSFLAPHNAARARKSLPPLSWDPVLEAYARKWGNHQRDTDNCNLVHSDGDYGENLFWGYGAPYTAADAVESWTEEEKDYNYATNSCRGGQMCGHYTQVVWKSTTKLGCATITCKDSAIFIICSYNPPGNYIGEKPY